jgi:hypothetical protein
VRGNHAIGIPNLFNVLDFFDHTGWIFDCEKALAFQAEGKSLRAIAGVLHVGKDTVRAVLMNASAS